MPPAGIVMVSITGESVDAAPKYDKDEYDKDGIFSNCGNGVTMTLTDYQIADCETPYSVWYEVKQWAADNDKGYTFVNKGRQGSNGTDGAAPTEGNSEPVTYISWRDAIVWCNAYSEKEGKTPVYVKSGTTTVLKDATAASDVDSAAIATGNPNGYRLPTEAQWEYAARGGSVSGSDWNDIYSGTNDSSSLSTYAVYGGSPAGVNSTANVKSKRYNAAGLYDMSGNVDEWCYDWSGSVPSTSQTDYMGADSGYSRVRRGGRWFEGATDCEVASRYSYYPDDRLSEIGFRVASLP